MTFGELLTLNITMKYADTEESQVRDAGRLLPF